MLIDYHTLSIWIVAIFTGILGATIYFSDPKSRPNIAMGVTVLFVVLWQVGVSSFYLVSSLSYSLFWIKFAYLAGEIIAAAFFIFSLFVTGREVLAKKILLPLFVLQAILFALYFFSDFIVREVYLSPDGIKGLIYGPGHVIFDLTFDGLFLASFLILLTYLKKKISDPQKTQVRYFLTAALTAVVFCGIFSILLPWFNSFKYFWVGPLFVIAWIAPTSYAIVRHRLFNAKIIATELFSGLILLSFLLNTFITAQAVLRIVLLVGVVGVVVMLINGAIKEFKQKEQLSSLTAELEDLNEHLQEKVDEQTKEIKQAYEVEKKARVELEELDKAKDQFILTTQHHLRTPLTIIKGYIENVLSKEHGVIAPAIEDSLNKASGAADRLSKLLNELLDVSQIQVGKSILNIKPTNMRDVIEDVLVDLKPKIDKKRISVSCRRDDQLWPTIKVDPVRIKEAFLNLIDNAIEYNQEGGEIAIIAEPTAHPIERDKKILRITVKDTGIGLTPEELSKLFSQYFERGEAAQQLYTTGRGIGLVVTKNIVQAHQGRVYAESEGRNKGARFIVELLM